LLFVALAAFNNIVDTTVPEQLNCTWDCLGRSSAREQRRR